jgi:hypothetical protein
LVVAADDWRTVVRLEVLATTLTPETALENNASRTSTRAVPAVVPERSRTAR